MSVYRLGLLALLFLSLMLAATIGFVGFVEMDFTHSARGTLCPAQVFSAALTQEGRVVAIAAPGPVSKGDLLVALDAADERDELKRTQAELQRLRQEHAKERPPLGDYRRRFALTGDINRLEAEQAKLKRAIAHKSLWAPFAGTVTDRRCLVGEAIAAHTPVLQLVSPSPLVFRSDAHPHEARRLVVGQDVSLTLDAYPKLTYGAIPGRLSDIHLVHPGEEQRYRLTVQLSPDTFSLPLLAGMEGTAHIVTFRGTPLHYIWHMRRETRQPAPQGLSLVEPTLSPPPPEGHPASPACATPRRRSRPPPTGSEPSRPSSPSQP